MPERTQTPAERAAAYRRRIALRGLARVDVVAPVEDAAAVRAFAAALRTRQKNGLMSESPTEELSVDSHETREKSGDRATGGGGGEATLSRRSNRGRTGA